LHAQTNATRNSSPIHHQAWTLLTSSAIR